MKEDLKAGTLSAGEGQKKQGMLEVPGAGISLPVTLINGAHPGKTLLITSGVHGGEYPGIETAIELAGLLDPAGLSGSVILVHPANPNAFWARVSYVNPGDGKNLNRSFPGNAEGTQTEKIAHFITTEMMEQADFCVDLHGGDLHEELPPYAIYSGAGSDEVMAASREAAARLTVRYIVKSAATAGVYGCAALKGIPSILIERGGRGLWSEEEVAEFREDLMRLMRHLGILPGEVAPCEPPLEFKGSKVIQAPCDGCWYPMAKPEERLQAGQKIGEIRDCFGKTLFEAFTECEGFLLYRIVSLAVSEGAPVISYALL